MRTKAKNVDTIKPRDFSMKTDKTTLISLLSLFCKNLHQKSKRNANGTDFKNSDGDV
jgi:hypothetical protein